MQLFASHGALDHATAGTTPLEPALDGLLTDYLGSRRDEYFGQ